MNVRLYIDDVLVDLPEDAARQLRLSKAGSDASDLESRSADISYTLTLPPTRTNHAVFRNASEHVKAGKFYRAAATTARLEAAGMVLLSGGYVLKSIRAGYSVQLYSGEVDVFALLQEKTLQELQFSPWGYRGGHDFPGLLDQPVGAGTVCFPLVAYGDFFANPNLVTTDAGRRNAISTPIELEDYPPSVYLLAIIRQMFSDLGWQAVGEVLGDPEWGKKCLPYTGEGYRWNWGELLKLEANGAITGQDFARDVLGPVEGFYTYFMVLEPDIVYSPAMSVESYSTSYDAQLAARSFSAYTAKRAGGYAVELLVQVAALSRTNAGSRAWSLELLRAPAGTPFDEAEVLASETLPEGASGLHALQLPYAPLEVGDLLVPVLRLKTDADAPTISLDLPDVRLTVTPDAEVGPLAISIQENLPALGQLEVLKAFCTMANLRFALDASRRTISFYYRDRYELPADFAVDLSGRADPKDNEYLPALAARVFRFGWAEDKGDALQPEGAGYAYDTGNALAQGEVALTLPFAATALRAYSHKPAFAAESERREVLLPAMASAEQLAAPLHEVQWGFGYTPRLINYEGKSAPGDGLPLAFVNRSFDATSAYGRASVAGLGWHELQARYYAGFLEGMARGHVTRNRFALTPALYRRLAPNRPVLFDGVVYRLSKVEGYQPAATDLTTVELLYLAPAASGGGKPAGALQAEPKEFYGGEFYSSEWY